MKLSQSMIEQLKNGNDALFEKIYHDTKRGVYGIIFSILRDHDQTNDAMQEVYMKMLIKINQYKIGSNFISWLMQIAKYHAIDMYRKDKNKVHVDDDVLEQMTPASNDEPDKKTQVAMMLDILDEDERIIVVLKVLDDLTHKEISKVVDKPLGTVLWIYQKAIAKLKKYYGEKDA